MNRFSISTLSLVPISPLTLTAIVGSIYLIGYTGYDKISKTIQFSLLYDFVTLSKGLNWTLVEVNKAASLTGLTTLLLSFLPWFQKIDGYQSELIWISMNILWGHSIYSMYKFYGYDFSKIKTEKPIKQLSITLGSLGQMAILSGYLGYYSMYSYMASILLGLSHFWTMEVDYKYRLQVRPLAYLPFPLAIFSLGYIFTKKKE